MSELRWILLAAGLVLIAAVYLLGTRSRQRSAAAPVERPTRFDAPPASAIGPSSFGDTVRFEPSLEPQGASTVNDGPPEPPIDFDEPPAMRATAPAARREPTLGPSLGPPVEPPVRPRQKIVTVRVLAVTPARFEGDRLQEAMDSEGLEFGRYDIFHRLHRDGRPIFSVASLREPGTFDREAMAATSYPGIALFSVLPGPLPATETFDQLIFTARALASLLGGSLGDDRGAPLTVHRMTQLREEILAFEQPRPGGATG
jgi:cell division protein ZipA